MRLVLGLVFLTTLGCSDPGSDASGSDAGPISSASSTPEAPSAPSPSAPASEDATPRPTHPPLRAGEQVQVPAGTLRIGSLPGSPGRDPRHEADLETVELPAFAIDRLPWPNDPNQPPRVGTSRVEAAELCASEGRRLCSELEWERACKGDGVGPWAGGTSFDVERCGLDPLACASPLGVAELGVRHFEWTASDVNRGLGSERWSAVVRGGRVSDPEAEHRCAARHALGPDRGSREVTFRCCSGDGDGATYPEEERMRSFRVLRDVDDARLRSILATIPQLEPFASDFRVFDELAVDRALGRGGRTRDDVTWNLLAGVVRWSPVRGAHAWVFAGAGGGSSLVAVIHPLPDGTFVHGASFVLRDETVPIAIAWDYGSRREILWSACWGCAGEGGAILYREDHRIVVVQR